MKYICLLTVCLFASNALPASPPVNPAHLRCAIEILEKKFGDQYGGEEFLTTLQTAKNDQRKLSLLRDKALVTNNPLFDFSEIMYVRHAGKGDFLYNNWLGTYAMSRGNHDSSIQCRNIRTGKDRLIAKALPGRAINDIDLDFDASRIVYAGQNTKGRWQIWAHDLKVGKTRMINTGDHPDIDNYDPVILPNGKIIFMSTRTYVGIPCIAGASPAGAMYITDSDGKKIRQISFDQDSSWNPTVMPNGKVMYTRWEYTDNSHYYTRILMSMNPDGSNQMNFYGSNSYFPNSMFYTRMIPGSATKFVTIASGHHGTKRSGRMLLFDTAKGRTETLGLYAEIGEHSEKMKAPIRDRLVDKVPVHFLNPYPLDENFFLVARRDRRSRDAKWQICLVDTFQNVVPLIQTDSAHVVEPIPLRKSERPSIIPSKIDLTKKTGTVHLVDIYKGPGLKGVPRGTVKKLRVFAWHYTYPQMGGHQSVSFEGGWEPKILLGTVPVEKDGSAFFELPAITPVAIQPLDDRGQALQIMRSWFVVQPGENMGCVGCHEAPNLTPPSKPALALRKRPVQITSWKGPSRTISFSRDIQVVLDKHCVGCHDGKTPIRPNFSPNQTPKGKRGKWWSEQFTPAYVALHPYVRRPGPESDMAMLFPLEYHASTSELVQMLRKGHHGVKLDEDSWQRLVTWIDLNVPDFGSWGELNSRAKAMAQKRNDMARLYAPVIKDIRPEEIVTQAQTAKFIPPAKPSAAPKALTLKGWPATTAQTKAKKTEMSLNLTDGVTVTLVRIPAGKFVMGDVKGFCDEWPQAVVNIDKAFWMGKFEITNAQYAKFDPKHNSRYIDQQWKDHVTPGYPANLPNQPVIRISWQQAMTFCRWLSKKTGKKVTLPTEAQWEYAARAGTAGSAWYGTRDSDFGKCENLADESIKQLPQRGGKPWKNPPPIMDFVPREKRFNDGKLVACNVGGYQANPWGLHDMIGNVAEWTRSNYRPYPYKTDDGRNDLNPSENKVLRGGSWRDRPKWGRSSVRRDYRSYQPVYNGGFRIIAEE
jgi:formylglycine-generating enzyme required for sulfatase activity